MTWPKYAEFLGQNLSTVYKIASGATTRPHELTVDEIEQRLAQADGQATAEGATREVVSSGQFNPPRSED